MSNTDNIEDQGSDEKPKSLNKSYSLIRMTTENSDLYRTNSKMILVTRDPVYTNKTIVQGHYIGPKPHNYLPLAIFVTIINPLLGPISIMLSVMSNRAYAQGDTKYALKWSLNSFFWSVISIVVAIVVYLAIGFSLSNIRTRGGYIGY
ncbi:233 isoform X2 [Octopus vulgaris]|uniref:233 isoform X2 n=3 Tax=Octopus TaxID=6643 RepID=A0AA36BAE1_OCTVU|nr:uncharacterized protein LOC115217430 isoform X1 [Octopus sinensis]CAI9730788.1 233 isoform X2 [Octopus vulgaris]